MINLARDFHFADFTTTAYRALLRRAGETWTILDALGQLGSETWFKLGDKDLALHLFRADMRAHGQSLTAITRKITQQFKIAHQIVPISDDPVRTYIDTEQGPLAFQDYFVRHRCEPKVRAIRYEGALRATPGSDAIAALSDSSLRGVIICPSNPYLSVGPILALPALRKLLDSISAPVVAVSPIIGGKALKGPAAKIMGELGLEVSSLAVADHYRGIADGFVIDEVDRTLANAKRSEPQLFVTNTVMVTPQDRIALAENCLRYLDALR